MKKPKWQISFPGQPDIPSAKRWIPGASDTLEQRMTQKLSMGVKLDDQEKESLDELVNFYSELDQTLTNLDYNSLSKLELRKFKNYILYAFNYHVLVTNRIKLYSMYRVVVNESVQNSTDIITHKKYLTYPPIHVVRRMNKLNRANTPKNTVFYASESIDSALNELKPRIGDVVTVGVWRPKENNEFNTYPISHSEEAFGVNNSSTNAKMAFQEQSKNQDIDLTTLMEPYFKLLGREYSKPVENHIEYLISALLSDHILKDHGGDKGQFNMDAIVYPSVGNKFSTTNFAFRRDVIKYRFDLTKVKTFEITDTHYENSPQPHPEQISFVSYSGFKQTSEIHGNEIIWE